MNKKVAAGIVGLITLGIVSFTQLSTEFDIVLPNGERLDGVVLSAKNYTEMQNNVGVFWVGNSNKNIMDEPNMNYCTLAKWIWDGHIGFYDKIAKDFMSRMVPEWCYPELMRDGYLILEWNEDNRKAGIIAISLNTFINNNN